MAQNTNRPPPGHLAQGTLHVFLLFESTYALVVLDDETTKQLQLAERANNNIVLARDLLQLLEAGIPIEHKKSMERIISNAEYGLRIVAQSLQPARCRTGQSPLTALQSRNVWILGPDNQEVTTALRNFRTPYDSLMALIATCQSIQAASNASTATRISNDPIAAVNPASTIASPRRQDGNDSISMSEPGQLLHYRRILRNRQHSTNRLSDSWVGVGLKVPKAVETMEISSLARLIPNTHELPSVASPISQTSSRMQAWNPSLPSTAELEGCTPQPSSLNENGLDFFTPVDTPEGGSLSYRSSSSTRGHRISTPLSTRSWELPLDMFSDIKALTLSPSVSSARPATNRLQRQIPSNASACARRPVGAPRRQKPSNSSASRPSDGHLSATSRSSYTPISRRNSGYSDVFHALDSGNPLDNILDLHKTLSNPSLQSLEEQVDSNKGVRSFSISSSPSLFQGAAPNQPISLASVYGPGPHENPAESTRSPEPELNPSPSSPSRKESNSQVQSPNNLPIQLPPQLSSGPIPRPPDPFHTPDLPPASAQNDPFPSDPHKGIILLPGSSSSSTPTSVGPSWGRIGPRPQRKRSSWLYRQAERAAQ